jgi:type IV fimbrial biogenesis protein FimT
LSRRRRAAGTPGFTVLELAVTMVIIGLLTAIGVPSVLSFARSSALTAGAEELVTVLNQARTLAIKENTSICVTNDGTRLQYRRGSCGGTVWTGAGTDSAGFIRLVTGLSVSSAQSPVFSYLGAASPAATYVVTNPQDGRTLNVTVATTGRVRVAP